MNEKKTVLLQLGSEQDSKVVGQVDIIKERDGYVVSITLDADYEKEKGEIIRFAGRVPTILDFYSDASAWMPTVREALS